MFYNIVMDQHFRKFLQKSSKKEFNIFGRYTKRAYFCTRFPREESLTELTCWKGVIGPEEKNKKTSEKFWRIINKVLIFALRFAKKKVGTFLSYILSLSHRESEKWVKRKVEKTSEKVWWLKIKSLPLHPLLKRKQQVLWNIDKQYK